MSADTGRENVRSCAIGGARDNPGVGAHAHRFANDADDTMKVAVFSDVQANLPALEVAADDILAWRPDLVVMAGDLLNRGPCSRACLERFEELRRAHGWLPINGNHEVWVLRCGREAPPSPVAAEMRAFADFTHRQVADLQHAFDWWPDHLCFDGGDDASWVHITHGSLLGHRDGISASLPDEALAERLPRDTALFVGAHTHKPLVRRYGAMQILNVGSVGSPFDGDTRASYGRLELHGGRWRTEIRRLAYDRARAERDFHDSGFLAEGGPLTRILLVEWQEARVLMPHWIRRYQDAVLAGEIGLEASVTEFLDGIR